jgi:hypothetical protein
MAFFWELGDGKVMIGFMSVWLKKTKLEVHFGL